MMQRNKKKRLEQSDLGSLEKGGKERVLDSWYRCFCGGLRRPQFPGLKMQVNNTFLMESF